MKEGFEEKGELVAHEESKPAESKKARGIVRSVKDKVFWSYYFAGGCLAVLGFGLIIVAYVSGYLILKEFGNGFAVSGIGTILMEMIASKRNKNTLNAYKDRLRDRIREYIPEENDFHADYYYEMYLEGRFETLAGEMRNYFVSLASYMDEDERKAWDKAEFILEELASPGEELRKLYVGNKEIFDSILYPFPAEIISDGAKRISMTREIGDQYDIDERTADAIVWNVKSYMDDIQRLAESEFMQGK